MPALDEALTIGCPMCHAKVGEYCVSRHAVSIHAGRRAALSNLSRQADAILRSDNSGGVPTSRAGSVKRKKSKGRRSYPRKGRTITGPDYVPDSETDVPPFDLTG